MTATCVALAAFTIIGCSRSLVVQMFSKFISIAIPTEDQRSGCLGLCFSSGFIYSSFL